MHATRNAPRTAAAAPARAATTPVGPVTGRKGFHGRAVGSFVPQLTRKAFEKFGFSAATLLTDWAQIVGPQLAAYTSPDRLKWPRSVDTYGEVGAGEKGRPGATLILRVDGGRALDVEYQRRQILERINAYFGYRAVAELRILQAPVATATPRAVVTRTLAAKPTAPLPEIAQIADEGLRAALARMQAGIEARKRKA